MKLQNKVAIVTGAASGMGKAIAERFSVEGAAVVLADLNAEGVNTLADEINNNGGKAKAVEVNISNLDDIDQMIDTAVNEFGTLDILVNNAGIMDSFEPVAEVDDDRWDLIFDINTKGVMRAMRKAIPVFLDKGQGVIINTASSGGLNGAHAGATYTASKHAVIGLTKNTAFMYAQKGIRCNAIAPGAVATNISNSMKNVSQYGSERLKLSQSLIPNVGSPEDIANVALFLASDEASFVNGTTITADAGWTSAF
ncbi:SDR family oxidoreductase [Gracilibacillus caseinilyticus]|uniref:SDR family oxidoreductase n=1 Tax=Gracilibacillus caseinilyticus TaxID=2932256 RepID=A0ABY4EY02_9BACI|nr:SDR family oxidoreductase [Gracilibacillus caseinilyticus]UOQ48509.1 SDR family oxidoreductase [Gracilibacillus caseinilyticus]